ncbi:hypothetical protein C161_18234 [Paenibacillus sp. FSL R5-192]|nr:hypothetical protein C161_18234 [Paenibacillus sp. FSL R5-192]
MGPMLGSELQEQLIYKTNVKPNNARQILLRLRNEKVVLTTEPVKFARNQLLYFLPKQNLKDKLKGVIPDHGQTFHRLYQALIEQQGFLHISEFAKICAGVVNTKEKEKLALKQKDVYQIIDELLRLQIIEPILDHGSERFIVAKKEWVPTVKLDENNIQKRLKDLSFSNDFTESLLKWLERMNLAGTNSTHLFTQFDRDHFNGFYWNAIGYSYLWGLYKANEIDPFNPSLEKTPSSIVIESVLHRVMNKYDVAGFIARVSVLYGRLRVKDNYRIIPICFVQSIESDALQLARQRGIMVISISEVFGTKIAEAIKMVRELDPRKIDPEALAAVLAASDASGHDGKFGSLKGYVFNFIVASMFNNQGYTSKIGWKYEALNKKCECDVVISVDDEYLLVCEAKGYNEGTQIQLGESENDSDTVKKFFEKTCRIVEAATGKKVFPVFITSGEFSPQALEYMEEFGKRKAISKFLKMRNFPTSVYLDRKGLMDFFGNSQIYTEHKKILKEFFRDHKKEKINGNKGEEVVY